MTLIITKKEIEKISIKEIFEVVEKAFKAYGLEKVQMPAKSYLYFEKGDLRSMPAYINFEDINAAAIKSVNVHPKNKEKGLPTVMAITTLTDPETGYPLAVMDATLLTAFRTGAAGAIAAKYLSREDSKTAAFFGCGRQARTQLEALLIVRKIEKIKAYDHNRKNAEEFCTWAWEKFKIQGETCDTVEQACQGADILTTVTPSREPFIKPEYVKPGMHINAIGADAKGKEELFPEVLQKAKIVVDNWEQSLHSGEINIPVTNQIIKQENIYAELGVIVARKKPGRENQEEITVFDSTGLAIQDVASADLVYKKFKDQVQNVDFF